MIKMVNQDKCTYVHAILPVEAIYASQWMETNEKFCAQLFIPEDLKSSDNLPVVEF